MLRIATPEDSELVFSMVLKFLETTNYKGLFDKDKIKAVINTFIEADGEGKVILLYEDKGMIAGAVVPFFFGDIKQATELAWWVEPEARKEGVGDTLLSAFEYWAKEKMGCSVLTMAALDDKLEKFYVSKGYVLSEHIYAKEF